jgi:hypothetical protein
MVPTFIPQQATGPLPQASDARTRWERESRQSASATLELLEKTQRVLDTAADGATDSLREELARQRASFEQAMQEILQERDRITHERQVNKRHTHHSENAPDAWVEQLRVRAAGLFATNPTASAVWHTAADQQALGDILRLLDQAPQRNITDRTYDDALMFLRNLNASHANTPEALLLRDQLRTITNQEAHEQLQYTIDSHQSHNTES